MTNDRKREWGCCFYNHSNFGFDSSFVIPLTDTPVSHRQWFLLSCAGVGTIALIAMLPPRVPKPTPAPEAAPSPFVSRPSSLIPSVLPTDPILGDPNAPLTIIEYGDFTCPSCIDAETVLRELRQEYGMRLRIIWKDFPVLDRITGSRSTHLAARCAQQQGKFWEYHDAALDGQPQGDAALAALAEQLQLDRGTFAACLTSGAAAPLVEAHLNEARWLQVTVAPTFFVNGTRLESPHPTSDDFRDALNAGTR